ncbi:MAG: hypothetical protein AAGH57_01945 [Pseudomonadota bacterium]
MIRWLALFALLTASATSAKESLGVYSDWAAFRDPQVPRCYAIAASDADERPQGYASLGTWPARGVRNQVYIRLSRAVSDKARVRIFIAGRRFDLKAQGSHAWAADKAMDASIIAAMRSARRMSVSARARDGQSFTDRYDLEGAATAMDAAIVGCAPRRN